MFTKGRSATVTSKYQEEGASPSAQFPHSDVRKRAVTHHGASNSALEIRTDEVTGKTELTSPEDAALHEEVCHRRVLVALLRRCVCSYVQLDGVCMMILYSE